MRRALVLHVAAALLAASAAAGETARGSAFARWDSRGLCVGNEGFSAMLRMRRGILRTVSLVVDGTDLLRHSGTNVWDALSVAEIDDAFSTAGERELALAVSSGDSTATVRVWPGAAAVVVEQAPAADRLPEPPDEKAWGSGVFSFGWSRFARLDGCGDALLFASPHLTARAFTPIDRTDLRAELLDVREFAMPTCEAMTYLKCGALDVRETLTGRGALLLRLAPMPGSRTGSSVPDFAVNPSTRGVMAVPTGYPLAVVPYSGGEVGRLRALHELHRSMWPRRKGRDGLLISNTWGDGNRDSRINEAFLQKEIDAAADIGVEVVQIDDGWQKGRSANSSQSGGKGVWNGYWAADPEFWTADPVRFPNGLAALAEAAKERGLSLGLWFGPDSSDDAANWERDADCLLDFWRTLGIRHFKIDSLKLKTPVAFSRNRRFFAKMLQDSGFGMCFDLDCTAEVRPGFLGGMPVGALFVENRYAHRRGDMRVYYPHQTLRSLWSLAHLIDPVRLRMEFLNPAKRNGEYGDDPLRPAAWPADALFAITMIASPLAWMELSDVPEPVREKWRPLIATWKRERDRLHDCLAVPVGARPDGVSWTGFVSIGDNGGYALVFREMNDAAEWRLDLERFFPGAKLDATVLSGQGNARVDGGALKVSIPDRLGFLWLALSASKGE